jgi:hypothetical protein
MRDAGTDMLVILAAHRVIRSGNSAVASCSTRPMGMSSN